MGWELLFGTAAGAVASVDVLPYCRDVLRRTTVPQRSTWGIWSVLAIVAFASQAADGGRWSLVMVGVQAVTTVAVFLLALRRGVGGAAPLDLFSLGVAVLGVGVWAVSSQPVMATIAVVVADAMGVVAMLPKAWRDPASETLTTYSLASLSGLLGTLAVGGVDVSLLIFPVYFAVANGLIAILLVVAQRRVAPAPGAAQTPGVWPR